MKGEGKKSARNLRQTWSKALRWMRRRIPTGLRTVLGLLLIVGGIFVMEAGSVILQVGSFKLRKKRIFRMSPIHHHFELKGWHENKVVIRFWILSLIFAMAGLATLKLR